MTPQERLDIYETALEDWRSVSPKTREGLCLYFYITHGLTYDSDRDIDIINFYFPELQNQKPQETEIYSEYWFEIGTQIGRHQRRICLIKAIKEVKLLIQNSTK